ncbi:uncharacterized protein BT62DRAFT_909654 [Guyanagaster necrorhizus]|uniref:Uncharacterized protein n=1 Tax=Guyanagaster necrorhizus TaxID=856835 RepID=A0A9P7VHR7_9AGAR|nr:uncharacterized protein BT62DRAFT_909654 [Guyanagaster necrorhizus MCA 3950]KAG7440837.1 hypothetical protein BT62DRAFT_909654 [Guyanagaster necrorhizus MCA 3950]
MSPSPSENSPWPTQTPADAGSSHSRAPKRRRIHELMPLNARQIVDQDQVEEAEYNCEVNSGNDVISCFPTADSVFPQHQWSTFVWNSGLPEFTQTNEVNVYLFRADSREQLLFFPNQTNPRNQAGSLTAQVNDTWFGTAGEDWSGSNLTYTFYWVVTRNDTELDGSELTQTHFTAVQTTYADSVLATLSSTSSTSSSTSSTRSSSSYTSTSTASSASESGSGSSSSVSGNGNVQSGASDSNFPHWAIAVIVVLGFLAIATSCILAFFILRRIRRRNAELESNRNSMGSSSPMMAHVGNSPGSPLLAAAAGEPQSSVGHGQRAPSIVSPDGASTVSGSAGDAGPFSGADAAIMADAFRKALRKPDFMDVAVEEGDSPGNNDRQGELLNRELADEGRDIRSVSSSRGVRVETMSDSGDTVQDNPH